MAKATQTKRPLNRPTVYCRLVQRYKEWFVLTQWEVRSGQTDVVVKGRCCSDAAARKPIQDWTILGGAEASDGMLLSGPFEGDAPAGFEVSVGIGVEGNSRMGWTKALNSRGGL